MTNRKLRENSNVINNKVAANNTAFFIDGAGRYEIAGTIAGDDTILLIPRDGITVLQVHTCLEIILPGIHEQIKKK